MDDQVTAPVEPAAATGVAETPAVDTMEASMSEAWDRLNADDPPPAGHNGGPEIEAETAGAQRDERGRFAGQAAETNAEAPQPGAATPTTAGAPEGWPADAATQWDKLPRAAQEALKADLAAGRIGPTAAQASAPPDPIVEAVKPFEAVLAASGRQVAPFVQNAAQWALSFERDPHGTIRALAAQSGMDLGQLAPGRHGQQPAPEVHALRNELAALKGQLVGVTQAEEQRQVQAATAQVQDWSKDKPHFTAVRTEMAKLVQTGYGLDDAYAMACARDPQVRAELAKVDETKRRDDAARHATQATRAAAVNVRSTPTGAPAKPRSIEDSMSAAYDRLMGAA